MIEAAVVIAIACLIFFGLVQVSQLFAARAVTTYAAVAGVRARMVGFNTFMVYKVVRAASIPNAGAMTEPGYTRSGGGGVWGTARPGSLWDFAVRSGSPRSPQYSVEQSRIPLYLGAEYINDLDAILDYENWDGVSFSETTMGSDIVGMRTRQSYPLVFPFHRTFYRGDDVTLYSTTRGEGAHVLREAHYPSYLE